LFDNAPPPDSEREVYNLVNLLNAQHITSERSAQPHFKPPTLTTQPKSQEVVFQSEFLRALMKANDLMDGKEVEAEQPVEVPKQAASKGDFDYLDFRENE